MKIYVPEKRFSDWLTNGSGKNFKIEGTLVTRINYEFGTKKDYDYIEEEIEVTDQLSYDIDVCVLNPEFSPGEVDSRDIEIHNVIFYTINSTSPIFGCYNFYNLGGEKNILMEMFAKELRDHLGWSFGSLMTDFEDVRITIGGETYFPDKDIKYPFAEICILDKKLREELCVDEDRDEISSIILPSTKYCICPNDKKYFGDEINDDDLKWKNDIKDIKTIVCEFDSESDRPGEIKGNNHYVLPSILVKKSVFVFPLNHVIRDICPWEKEGYISFCGLFAEYIRP